MGPCHKCKTRILERTAPPSPSVDWEAALNLKQNDWRASRTVSSVDGRLIPNNPPRGHRRLATFWWLMHRRLKEWSGLQGSAHRGEVCLPFSHLVAIVLYLNGAGVKSVVKRLGGKQANVNSCTQMLKECGAFEPGRRSPAWDGKIPEKFRCQPRAHVAERRRLAEEARKKKAEEIASQHAEAKRRRMTVTMVRYYRNHEESKARARERYHLLKADPDFKMMRAARNCVSRIARKVGSRRWKRTSTEEYLGCTYDQARAHIEAQFKLGMSWENHGDVWEIDHIRPLASFDLSSESDVRAAMHYTNLQPLYWKKNLAKSDKWDGQLRMAV